jgi:thiol-disulfide isomerase/thioredoxin
VNSPHTSTPRAALAIILIVGAAAGGFFAYRALTEDSREGLKPAPAAAEAPSPATAEVQAEPATQAPPAETARKVPDTLPEITLQNRDGKPTALSQYANRPLMVNFWATWCAPCRREIPLLNRLRRERRAQNVEIVGVAVDFRDKVIEFTQKVPLEYPLLIGEEDGLAAAEAFGMGMAFPFSIFVDSQNRILTVKVGELHEDEANFAFDRLLDIDKGVLTRAHAQAQVRDAFREMAAARAKVEATVQAADRADHAE